MNRVAVQLSNEDVLLSYAQWPSPTIIMSDGAYGLGMGDWDAKDANSIANWYRPHVEVWTQRATPETTLWFWNTEIGWANVHPVLQDNGWVYKGCNIWNKGAGHMAGNVNTKTIRKFPVVTEVCVQYTRREQITINHDGTNPQNWLRNEWRRTGLTFASSNKACGVKNAATRKYLTGDSVWYYPPTAAFDLLSEYANSHGDPKGRPYFSVDGISPMKGSQWAKQRAKFTCPFGRSNVWDTPGVRGVERLKENGKTIHPNQKPLSIIKMLIECSSEIDDVVWEPFAGTATTLVACVETNRKGYGSEIDQTYYNIAQTRLSQYTLALLKLDEDLLECLFDNL